MASATIYVYDDLSGIAESTRCLFESQNLQVNILENVLDSEVISKISSADTVIIHLEDGYPQGFSLLNHLIFKSEQPYIILTTDKDGSLSPDDSFPGERVNVLVHPFDPKTLIEAVTLH